MTPDEIRAKAEALTPWYHEIELCPGYTPASCMTGSRYQWEHNRRVRASLDYTGKRVLEIGAMDGMWAFEAERLGASAVVAADIFQRAPRCYDRFLLARAALNSNVLLIPNGDVSKLLERLDWLWNPPFDIVQLLGVLYHLRDPMQALLQVRACIAESGTLFLETAVWLGEPHGLWLRFNADKGVYDDPTTWFVPTVPALHEMLRLSGFTVVADSAQTTADSVRPDIGRIALLATAAPLDTIAEYRGDLRLWL